MELKSITMSQDQWATIYGILLNIPLKYNDLPLILPIMQELERNVKIEDYLPKGPKEEPKTLRPN